MGTLFQAEMQFAWGTYDLAFAVIIVVVALAYERVRALHSKVRASSPSTKPRKTPTAKHVKFSQFGIRENGTSLDQLEKSRHLSRERGKDGCDVFFGVVMDRMDRMGAGLVQGMSKPLR